MRKFVTKPIKKAESILKGAEKANTKLAAYDGKVRDPAIKKYQKIAHHKLSKPPKLSIKLGK